MKKKIITEKNSQQCRKLIPIRNFPYFQNLLSNNLNRVSEPTWEDVLITPSADGSVKIGDMFLDEFQFNKVKGADISDKPGDGVAFSGISEVKYRWPNAELPYK